MVGVTREEFEGLAAELRFELAEHNLRTLTTFAACIEALAATGALSRADIANTLMESVGDVPPSDPLRVRTELIAELVMINASPTERRRRLRLSVLGTDTIPGNLQGPRRRHA